MSCFCKVSLFVLSGCSWLIIFELCSEVLLLLSLWCVVYVKCVLSNLYQVPSSLRLEENLLRCLLVLMSLLRNTNVSSWNVASSSVFSKSFVKVKVKISPSLLLHSKVISTAQLLDHLGCGLSKFLSNGRHQISEPLGQLALPILQVVVLGG